LIGSRIAVAFSHLNGWPLTHMRRKLLIGALSTIALALILIAAIFIYIRGGRLDLYVQNRILESLQEVGIRASIERLHLDITGKKVTLENLTLYAGQGEKPFGSIEKIEVVFSVIDYLKGKINITEFTIIRPQVWIEFDEQGRSNLEALHKPPESKPGEERVIYLAANVRVLEGKLNYIDRRSALEANLPDLFVNLIPLNPKAENRIDHRLEIRLSNASASYRGRNIKSIDSQVDSYVKEAPGELSVTVSALRVNSDLGEIIGGGRISSLEPFKYEFNLVSLAELKEIARLFAPEIPMSGKASLELQLEGTNADYRAAAYVTSSALAIEGYHITGLRLESDVNGSGESYSGKAELKSAGVSRAGISAGSIGLDASLSGRGDNFDVAGGLAISLVKAGGISLNNLRAHLDVDRSRINLSQLSASLLGGRVTGSAQVAYMGGTSRVDVEFNSIDLDQVAQVAYARQVKVRGAANGSAHLTFPAFNYKAATGRIDATFSAAASIDVTQRPPKPGPEGLPTTGQVNVIITGQGFNIEQAKARSAKSEFAAVGRIGWDATAALSVSFKSQDMSEVQRALDAFGLVPEIVSERDIALTDAGQFTGRIEGKLSAPTVSGHLALESIRVQDELFGSFEADVTYSPLLIRVENGAVFNTHSVQSGGGSVSHLSRADFSLNVPLPLRNNASLKASLQQFDLAALARVIAPRLEGFIGQGIASGTVELRGLPGLRTIEGSGDLLLTAAELNIPSTQGEEEAKKVSVSKLIGKVTLADSVLSLQDLQLSTGDSTITGGLSFNLDTYAYSINAQGRNIDLAQVSEALSSTLRMGGRADVIITGQGDWDDWATINLNATIQGHSVTLNGRDLGDAKLVAYTQGGLLKLEATGQLLDQPQTLLATVDLRDPKNYPISANIEFADAEIGPYLGLLAPQLANISGVATGTIKLSGPLQDPDQIQAIANLTKLELGGKLVEGRSYTIRNQSNIVLTATLKEVRLSPVTFVGEGTSIQLSGALSREASAGSNLLVSGEVNLRLISSFTQAVYTTGVAAIQAVVTGSLSSPKLIGFADLKDIGVRVVDFPLAIAHGNGRIRFTADQALIENFEASTPGGGKLTMAGGAVLAGLVPNRWRIEANADQVGVEYPRATQSVFDGNFVFEGNKRFGLLSGDVYVRRATYTRDITLADLIATGGPFGPQFVETGAGGGAILPLTLDIRVDADNTIVVRNNIVDAVSSAHLEIRGPVANPTVFGRLQFTRGTLEFRNDRYEITRGLITFSGARGAEPLLDFQTEADISGYRVTINFSGSPSRLHTALRSDPELPERDVISLVLAGRPAGDLTAQAAAQQSGLGLAQTLLSATLSEELGRQTQRIFGLSRFSIDPLIVGRGTDPTLRVTIGQRITKNLTITYSQNLTSGPSGFDRIVLVEYRISNRFSLIGTRDESGSVGFDVRIRKRF
jgi:translocation and assembly module TamB